ncbi:hypothetical protein CIHG_04374 [Coccidioides immitis H538.4]|uniref:Uncharacterized protein n=3 Tax=Coccidioides immitis TaxID=5501 RepID=A0A0J8R6S0_COCIT|nr:hypothetical protein CIRG_09307 [Coccidioides immitis RMSCC 2394]KMU80120.1 hypothetical protein CISG_08462 [Coccidioides immitis RMSCC 3703]KMU86586.1 hypothetical protein CIHG_04374 [Coccidioides immitis H538.4]
MVIDFRGVLDSLDIENDISPMWDYICVPVLLSTLQEDTCVFAYIQVESNGASLETSSQTSLSRQPPPCFQCIFSRCNSQSLSDLTASSRHLAGLPPVYDSPLIAKYPKLLKLETKRF